jgi:hypothetical protein
MHIIIPKKEMYYKIFEQCPKGQARKGNKKFKKKGVCTYQFKKQVGELVKFHELCTVKNREALRALHGKKWRNSASSVR